MKKLFIFSLSLLVSFGVFAQDATPKEGYKFTVVKENPISSIKDQASSGTCWAYSALGLIEADLMRTGKGEHDLSAMYFARRNYMDKAIKYVRLHGYLNFAQGGAFEDVIGQLDEYGVVPTEVYQGLNYGEPKNKHGELEASMKTYLESIIKNPNGKLSTAWYAGLNGILDAYFGKLPSEFTYNGKQYTAKSFAKELGLKADNYLSITSFTHHPFYKEFAIEIQDNWRWANSWNLPIDEFMSVIDNAINTGHTIAWGSDVSEIGFTRQGIAVLPDEDNAENAGSDQAHWLGLSPVARMKEIKDKVDQGPMAEKSVTQESRQEGFDNYQTTDDHGMVIYGIAKDQNGAKYYMVKNSWGKAGKFEGLWYASEAFVKAKTISIMIHKDAMQKPIQKKLGL